MPEPTVQLPPASQGAVRPWLGALTSTRGYDLGIRIVFICCIFVLALPSAVGLDERLQVPLAMWDLELVAEILARSGILLFLLLSAFLVVIRTRPVGKARGLQPRLSALAGSFLLLAIVVFPRHDLSIGFNLLSAGLIFLGHALAAYALAWLGRSFSIMAEARHLVTAGPYARVRHPLYVAEAISAIGLFIQFASLWTALLLIAHAAFQLQRLFNEERILAENFPEYPAYASRTSRLIPGVF